MAVVESSDTMAVVESSDTMAVVESSDTQVSGAQDPAGDRPIKRPSHNLNPSHPN
jgi:hypothetical protein